MSGLLERGWVVVNADVCLIGERPKIAAHRERMRDRVAPVLGLDPEDLNVKATTTEKLGFTGRGEGLAAQAVVLIERA
jgi:2-C-methyl-D-erythritol 2,4-cyclodiphosphate synthase